MKSCWSVLLAVFLATPFLSCGSSEKRIEAKPDRIVQQSSDDRPDWIMEKPRFVKKNIMFVSGQASVRGDQSMSQCVLAAELDAKARLTGEIGGRLSRQIQSASEGFSVDNQTMRTLTSMATERDFISGSYISERYYEKVAFYSESNLHAEQTRYDCYALAAIPMDELKKQMAMAWTEYENKKRGKDAVTPELRQRFEQRWDEYFREDAAARS